MSALVELEVIFDGEPEPQLEQFDLGNSTHCFALVVGFGNQIYDEVRATAHSPDSAVLLASLLRGGGFTRCDLDASGTGSRLGKPDDICLNASSPYVWLSPTTTSGDRFDLPVVVDPVEEQSTMIPQDGVVDQYPEDVELVILSSTPKQKKKAWWKLWK